MIKHPFILVYGSVLLFIILAFFGILFFISQIKNHSIVKDDDGFNSNTFVKFNTEDDFFNFLEISKGDSVIPFTSTEAPNIAITEAEKNINKSKLNFSQTNVQVLGVDEPDIVKTDGKSIFVSYDYFYRIMPFVRSKNKILPDDYFSYETKIIGVNDKGEVKRESSLKEFGKMLISDNVLVLFSNTDNSIYGYDISDRRSPKKIWSIQNEFQLSEARLLNERIYLVSKKFANFEREKDCSIKLFTGSFFVVQPCLDVYYNPESSSDYIYNVSLLNPKTGEISNGITFFGNRRSEVYVSDKNIYVLYTVNKNSFDILKDFFNKNIDIFGELSQKIKKVLNYDISNQAKFLEIRLLVNERINSDKDFRKTLEDRIKKYVVQNAGNSTLTKIIKIDINNFSKKSEGKVPGFLYDRFAVDEYDGNLRIVSTIDTSYLRSVFSVFGIYFEPNSLSTLYVLDSSLKEIGSVSNMGISEKVYSVRMVKNKAYIVTFKKVDPFYVLSLDDPKNPKIEGELKMPGFSSYLHVINNNFVLGVGKEKSNIKLSLFDVSNLQSPTEKSKLILPAFFSDVLQDPKAFLVNYDREFFFMPTSSGAYIVSYKNDQLNILKYVDKFYAKRAVFVGGFIYLISDDEMLVLDMNSWGEIERIKI